MTAYRLTTAGVFNRAAFEATMHDSRVSQINLPTGGTWESIYLSGDRKSGFYIKRTEWGPEELKGLFSTVPGRATGMIRLAQSQSPRGLFLTCYGEKLASIYARNDFAIVSSDGFDPDMAHENWREGWGRPVVFSMVWEVPALYKESK